MNRLVATKSGDRRFHNIHLLGFASYIGAVRSVLLSCEESATIVTPFIDDAGIDLLCEIWSDSRNKEGTWSIFVRDTSGRLLEEAAKRNWELYSYSPSESSGEEYGLHAKLVSVDGERAVVGSMNLLRRNLYSNLELGVELETPEMLWRLERLIRAFRRVGKRASPY